MLFCSWSSEPYSTNDLAKSEIPCYLLSIVSLTQVETGWFRSGYILPYL
jgi:hypothetical protein